MKIEMFGKEREFTLKGFLFFIGKILLLYGFIKSYSYYIEQVNAEGVAKMQTAIPAVVSMDGTQSLPEKIEMVSRTIGFYSGSGQIDEKASEKEIVTHYKNEFQKYGWKYIGKYYSETFFLFPRSNDNKWYYYCFEKEGDYFMSLSIKRGVINFDGTRTIIFHIGLKEDWGLGNYRKIEDEEP